MTRPTPPMNPQTDCLASRNQNLLVDRLLPRLRGRHLPSYADSTEEDLRRRAVSLVHALCESLVEGEPSTFLHYLEQTTHLRICEGYRLAELQYVLAALEDEAWAIVEHEARGHDRVAQLRAINLTIGAARDGLARTYLEHKNLAESRAAWLEEQLQQLFKGTICPPIYAEEDDWAPPTTLSPEPPA